MQFWLRWFPDLDLTQAFFSLSWCELPVSIGLRVRVRGYLTLALVLGEVDCVELLACLLVDEGRLGPVQVGLGPLLEGDEHLERVSLGFGEDPVHDRVGSVAFDPLEWRAFAMLASKISMMDGERLNTFLSMSEVSSGQSPHL